MGVKLEIVNRIKLVKLTQIVKKHTKMLFQMKIGMTTIAIAALCIHGTQADSDTTLGQLWENLPAAVKNTTVFGAVARGLGWFRYSHLANKRFRAYEKEAI